MRFLLIVALSVLFFGWAAVLRHIKHLKTKPVIHLMLYGMVMALPFILVEWIAGEIRPILLVPIVILEFLALFCEEHIRFLDHELKKNLAHLGLWSYLFIGLGFSYFEMVFYVIHTHNIVEVIAYTPFKMLFAPVVHVTLFLSVGIASLGQRLWHFLRYYSEIAYIGASHFLYIILVHHHMAYLFVPFLVINVLMMKNHVHLFDEHVKELQAEFALE